MRLSLLVLCGGLIAVGGFLAGRTTNPAQLATPANATTPMTADRATINKMIRDFLMTNPEVLVDAMQELEKKQESERDNAAQRGIVDHAKELTSDPDSPIAGNPQGDVTVVEFSDYQCPYCKRSHAAVKSVIESDGKVKLVYKDLPILGEASKIAAFAALASIKQNKHEAFHNALMEFNGRLDRDRILEIASSVGIDTAQLQKDMEDPKLKAMIDRNMALASALGVRGTPAFVIGKQFVPGAVDADALKQLINEARKG